MKKISLVLASLATMVIIACNNDANDSVEKADSTNQANLDSGNNAGKVTTDEESANFLVKAANGGMAEVQLGQMAEQKGTNAGVKRFGSMMAREHGDGNEKVKALASARNVALPATVGEDMQKHIDDLNKKSGADFDKAYINLMVDDHQKDIDLFEDAEKNVKDTDVKTFISNTIPKLKMHLDSARAVQKRIK